MNAPRPPSQLGESPLDPERVHELFVAARQLPPAERRSFLDTACRGGPGLRLEVESLLAHDAAAEGFLTAPVWRALAEHASPLLAPGERVGHFTILSHLDRGGSGRVYLARDERSRHPVALKVFVDGRAGAARARMLREAAAAAAVRHPHLVEVLHYGEDDERGHVYCAMRLVEGPSLQHVLADVAARGRRLDPSERRSLVARIAEVADGLAALHRHGIVHRDVKPANIVLAAPSSGSPLAGSAVLVDLGLAVHERDEVPASTVWLSFDYAAPEQVLGHAIGPAADVYALGVTLHDLLAGRPPHERRRAGGGRLESLRELAPEVGADLAAVVAMATDPEVAWRYPDAAALGADLKATLAGRRVAARGVPAVVRFGREVLRQPQRTLRVARRAALTAGLVSALTLASLFLLATWRNQRATSDAWALGDLAALASALRTRSALAAAFLPSAQDVLARDPPSSAAAVHAVLRVGQAEGWERALVLATRYLQRDGLQAHPTLARFHALSLDQDPTGPALRWTTRLLFERPAMSAVETAALAPVRATLTRLLAGDLPLATAMDALVALSGCPDERTLATCVAFARRLDGADSTSDSLECERVLVRGVAAVLRRLARPRGGARTLGAAESRALFDLCRRALARAEPMTTAGDRAMGAVVALATEVALAERTQGGRFAEAWHTLVTPGHAVDLDAARGDPDLRALILRGEDPLGRGRDGPDAGSPAEDALRLGFVAGLLGDDACALALRQRVRTRARDETEAAVCGQAFELRRTQAVQLAAGMDPGDAPDVDACLGAELGGSADVTHADGTRLALPERVESVWDFCTLPARIASAPLRFRCSGAGFGRDEIVSGATYLRLARPGTSSVTLPFVVRPVRSGNLRLRLEVQKGVRAPLPYDGEAALDVLLDGVVLARSIRVVTSSTAHIELPLCPATGHERREVGLRLSSDSTTTLRLYRVELLP